MITDLAPTLRRNLPPTAQLRVFSPLRAFSDVDQILIQEQPARSRAAFDAAQRVARLRRATKEVTDPFPHETTESYRVLHAAAEDGTATFWCPDQLPLRAGMAAVELEDKIPSALTEEIIPEAAAQAHLERLQGHGVWSDDEPLFTQEAVWGIPLSWFSLFDADAPVEIDDHDDVLTSARVHTTMTLAVERAARTTSILARTAEELPLVDELLNLQQWLEQFHPDSMVELDYGLLAPYVWPDDSVQDLHDGVEALDDGDLTAAAAAHHRLVHRWYRVRMLGRAG